MFKFYTKQTYIIFVWENHGISIHCRMPQIRRHYFTCFPYMSHLPNARNARRVSVRWKLDGRV